MLIDGEKWACEACVRGHRVSNCQHADRPLQHINKKGRPVSQCQHCRAMRKSRAAHTKCDCGEKTHKCAHLKAAVEGHKESCCCNHGGRCTCAHKKEVLQLTPVPESDSDREELPAAKGPRGGPRIRRRANTIHLDGMLSFDENGRHKPTHKHAKASQKCGPYQLNRVNSMHVAGTMSRRSAESNSGTLHGTDAADSGAADSPLGSGASPQGRSRAESEEASPLMMGSPNFTELNGRLPPLDLSGVEYRPYNLFGNLSDQEQPMFSAGLSSPPVDWSHYDGLDFASRAADFAPSNYSQPQSFGTFDYNGSEQPTLTTNTSNSGEVSEIEDFLPKCIEDFDDGSRYGTASTTSAGFNHSQIHGNLLSSADVAALSYDDFKLLKAGTKFLPTPASLAGEEPVLSATSASGITNYQLAEDETALWMNDYGHGLPGVPNSTDSPDPIMPNFWETQ